MNNQDHLSDVRVTYVACNNLKLLKLLWRGVQLNWRRRAESSVGLWMKAFLVCGVALSLRSADESAWRRGFEFAAWCFIELAAAC